MTGRPRLTGGRARGRLLPVPVAEGVRPTAARTREALFSLVGHHLAGRRFLDPAAGSGLVALEAWSRGASVVAIERDPARARLIRAAVDAFQADVQVLVGDGCALVGGLGAFDVAFVDPPYVEDPLHLVGVSLAAAPSVVVEVAAQTKLPEVLPNGVCTRVGRYGAAALWSYEARP